MIREGVDQDGGVLSRLDDLVEVADRAARTARVSGPSIHTVSSPEADSGRRGRCRQVLVAGDRDQARHVTTARARSCPRRQAMCSTKRVLPQPVGALEQHGQARRVRRREHLDLVTDR